MNFGLLSLSALCTLSNFLSAVRVGDFIEISGLVKKPEYNGSIAIVQKVGERDERHQVLKADGECIRNFSLTIDFDDCLKPILMKEANMSPVKWNVPEKLSLEQLYVNAINFGRFSSFVEREVTAEEREVLDRVVLLIRVMCNDESSKLHEPEITEKLRLIGAWINQNFDFHAMVYVCEAHRPFKNDIEWLWHEIGVWMH